MNTADLLNNITKLAATDPTTLDSAELFDLTIQIEHMTATFDAITMTAQAAAHQRKVHRSKHHRTTPIGIASQTRLNKTTCSRHLNRADLLVHQLPTIHAAYLDGALNTDQINLICSYARRPELIKPAIQDQTYFLTLAHHQWPDFQKKMLEWAETRDDTDPQDEDEKAHLGRRMVWAQGLGKTILAELAIPNDMFEQMLVILRPVYDRMLKQEWAEAQLAKGENPTLENPDDPGSGSAVTHLDLARTDRQRWLDALFLVVRAGAQVTKKLRIREDNTNADDTTDLADLDLANIDLADLDPGTLAQVVIVCDQETIERELQRQNGETLAPRTTESLKNYRCETKSGLQVTPTTVLKTLRVGHFRRMVLKPGDLDFSISELARFFLGGKRLGLQIRDRHCVTDGCGTQIEQCEADHIVEHTRNGRTVPVNGQMLCRPCHRHKSWLQARGHWETKSAPVRPRGPSLVGHD